MSKLSLSCDSLGELDSGSARLIIDREIASGEQRIGALLEAELVEPGIPVYHGVP